MNHSMSKSDNFVTFFLKTVFLQIWQLWPIFLQKQPLCDLEAHFLGHPSGPTISPQKSTSVTMVKTKNQKHFWVASKHYRYPHHQTKSESLSPNLIFVPLIINSKRPLLKKVKVPVKVLVHPRDGHMGQSHYTMSCLFVFADSPSC